MSEPTWNPMRDYRAANPAPGPRLVSPQVELSKAKQGGRVIVDDLIKAITLISGTRVHLPDVANLHNLMEVLFDRAFFAGVSSVPAQASTSSELEALRDRVALLTTFANHKDWCTKTIRGRECNCGLPALLAWDEHQTSSSGPAAGGAA